MEENDYEYHSLEWNEEKLKQLKAETAKIKRKHNKQNGKSVSADKLIAAIVIKKKK